MWNISQSIHSERFVHSSAVSTVCDNVCYIYMFVHIRLWNTFCFYRADMDYEVCLCICFLQFLNQNWCAYGQAQPFWCCLWLFFCVFQFFLMTYAGIFFTHPCACELQVCTPCAFLRHSTFEHRLGRLCFYDYFPCCAQTRLSVMICKDTLEFGRDWMMTQFVFLTLVVLLSLCLWTDWVLNVMCH